MALIRDYALYDPLEKTSADAWGDVEKEKKRVLGIYGKPEFEDETTKRVVEIIGWRNLCMGENVEADRAHFMKMYDQLKKRNKFKAMSSFF